MDLESAISPPEQPQLLSPAPASHKDLLIQPSTSRGPLSSRLFDDIFHVQNRLLRTLSKTHSAFKAFARAFSEVLLVPDKSDEDAVKAIFAKKNIPWKLACKSKSDAIHKRVRRYCPPPAILVSDLQILFSSWAGVKCTSNPKGKKLFSSESHKEAEGILRVAHLGLISDPPGISLYHKIGIDRDGLPLYRCVRGTNSIEGGIHMPLRRTFGSLQASPEFGDTLLCNIRHRHNTTVSLSHVMFRNSILILWLGWPLQPNRQTISWSFCTMGIG